MRNVAGALVAVLSVACASLGPSSTSALVNREWRLTSLRGQPAVPSTGMRAAGIRLSGDSLRMSGSGGCNRIGATYTLDGDRLSFGPILATRMACADAVLNRQETDFLAALQATTRYRIAGDTLILAGTGDDLARLLGAAR